MRSLPFIALALLAACGTDPNSGDDVVAVDGPPRVPVTMDVTANCQPFTRETRYPDGRREVTSAYYVVMGDNITIESDFAIEQCDLAWNPPLSTCPSGATCTGDTGPRGRPCTRTYRGGGFADGHLIIPCGTEGTSYAANGTVTGRSGYRYASVSVTVY